MKGGAAAAGARPPSPTPAVVPSWPAQRAVDQQSTRPSTVCTLQLECLEGCRAPRSLRRAPRGPKGVLSPALPPAHPQGSCMMLASSSMLRPSVMSVGSMSATSDQDHGACPEPARPAAARPVQRPVAISMSAGDALPQSQPLRAPHVGRGMGVGGVVMCHAQCAGCWRLWVTGAGHVHVAGAQRPTQA